MGGVSTAQSVTTSGGNAGESTTTIPTATVSEVTVTDTDTVGGTTVRITVSPTVSTTAATTVTVVRNSANQVEVMDMKLAMMLCVFGFLYCFL